ncbi:hypothetical protein DPMN_007419 [Dreissena polymorpha]|uniref:Uncharacterized protein n=1 Tax=Dreissena polymorpha TaxID=45954 RepID=A0A9D4MT90_DREPO|nr:hypothetical protein DPMN_007419 [Dreissena polymorpha]
MFGNYMLYSKELSLAISWDGSHNATKEDMAKFFNIDWIEPMFAYTDTLQRLELSIEEIALLRAIVLTFTGRSQSSGCSCLNTVSARWHVKSFQSS